MNFRTQIWVHVLLAVFPVIIGSFFWNELPDVIPVHWNAAGEPDRQMDKGLWFFLLPGISLLLVVSYWLLPAIDPKQNYALFRGTFKKYLLFIQLLLLAIFLFVLLNALGYLNIISAVIYSVLIFLLLIGNYLGKLRPSFFVGIRTPWTLDSETVWVKTHRFAGYLWVVLSLVTIAILLLAGTAWSLPIFFTYLAVIVIGPLVYSFVLYSRLKGSPE